MGKSSVTRIATLLIAGVLAVLGGCASLPAPDVMKAEAAGFRLPKLPDSGKAIVYVVRPSIAGTAIRFNVFVDDQEAPSEMGWTRGNQYIYFNLSPGKHTIYSKAENWAELPVTVQADDILFIQQEAEMSFTWRNNLLKLEDYQGKYLVKTTTLGTILKTNKDQARPGINATTNPLSGAEAERLAGNWSGTYSCGNYLGQSTNMANPGPFVAKVRMTLQGNRASITRNQTTVNETVSGDIASDLSVSMQGDGGVVGESQNVWKTKINGNFSVAGTPSKFTGDGNIYNSGGTLVRECKVSLSMK